MAERLRQEEPATPQEHLPYRRRPRLRIGARHPGPPAGVGGLPGRPAFQGIPLLPPSRAYALRQPRRLRHPHAGRQGLALLPGMGTTRRASLHHVGKRLAPYLRYFSSHRPTDDHGVQPSVLVVFEDNLVQTHFLRLAREEMQAAGVRMPLWVSHSRAIEALGPLGRAWRAPGDWDSPQALPPP